MLGALEGLLYIGGGAVRALDFGTDVYYWYSQEFSPEWLKTLCLVSLAFPSLILFMVALYLALQELCGNNKKKCAYSVIFGLLLAIFDPLGIILCFFGCMLFTIKKKQDFYIVDGLMRATGFVEGIFESLPQMVLQSYNNQINGA